MSANKGRRNVGLIFVREGKVKRVYLRAKVRGKTLWCAIFLRTS